jgi:hypothetical protein
MGPDHRMTVGGVYTSDFKRLNHPAATPHSLGRFTRIEACFGQEYMKQQKPCLLLPSRPALCSGWAIPIPGEHYIRSIFLQEIVYQKYLRYQ